MEIGIRSQTEEVGCHAIHEYGHESTANFDLHSPKVREKFVDGGFKYAINPPGCVLAAFWFPLSAHNEKNFSTHQSGLAAMPSTTILRIYK